MNAVKDEVSRLTNKWTKTGNCHCTNIKLF